MKMLRHCYLLVLFLFVAGLGSVRGQSFAWAHLIRGAVDTSFVQPQASATDAAGNTYVAVYFTDSLRLGRLLLTGPHNWSQAVIKYDSTGAVVWGKALVNIQINSLAADNSAGGVFVAAFNRGGGTWDGTAVPTTALAPFYAKCSAAGVLQWSNSLPAAYYFGNDRVVADNAGNAYISGSVQSSGVVSGTPVSSSEIFVLKTTGAGLTQWVRVLHGASTSPSPLYVKLGPKPGGGCLISGLITNMPLYLGTGTATVLLPSHAQSDAFLTSFDAAGTHQWSQVVGNPGSTTQAYADIRATAADASGNCYVTGTTYGNLYVGSSSLNDGFFLAKYNAAGALQWVRDAPGGTSFNSSGGTLLAVGDAGVTVVVGTSVYPLILGTLALRAPNNFVHYTAQGLAQWTVADAWTGPSPGPTPSFFLSTGLGSDAQGNLYAVGQPQFSYGTRVPVIQLGAQTTVGKGTIVARLNAYANTLRAQVYLDQNANGQQDASEGVFPRQLTGVLTQGSATTYSAVGTDGVLQAYAGAGAYALSLAGMPARYTVSQPSSGGTYSGTFAGTSQLVSGQNFGIAPIPNLPDIRITLTPYSVARAGFTTRYRLTLENVGTTTVPAGTVTVTLDALAQYVSSTPSGTAAGRVITLSYSALPLLEQLSYDILFSLPVNTPLATALTTTAAAPLAGDVAPADNAATLAQTVVGAYDPNSIEVNYQRLTPAQVAAQQPLDYTIHFQNLGTASASNVILSDTLDFQKLNPATLMLVAQSHNCLWSLTSTGPNTGLLTVRFLNINLPYRNADVIGSQGFVRFRVQPRPTLAVGEVIPNEAGIVFDYNDPVLTNTATTTVFLATAALASHEAPAWDAYPNPATDAVTVAAELATAGAVQLELLDVLGRPVRQQTLTAPAGTLRQTLDLRGLAAGVYVLRLTPPTGPATSRRVVRE